MLEEPNKGFDVIESVEILDSLELKGFGGRIMRVGHRNNLVGCAVERPHCYPLTIQFVTESVFKGDKGALDGL